MKVHVLAGDNDPKVRFLFSLPRDLELDTLASDDSYSLGESVAVAEAAKP